MSYPAVYLSMAAEILYKGKRVFLFIYMKQ